ncbi:MAG: hypothetical protein DKM50_01445 [Candidatus Margulisiibacteriota bacterium]|nr:MAG: hypothetical protein A2X43_08365 [Candidatus Margulisbacteria bacterium GWD2_39_127]OGI01290.1 MAG: hypothetical protein A2X42_06020 [Candidatus Margulisbacteria bacterium GWF2_38_17]OGI09234.1 MAG: hypothetical protein A2X41_01505 [Candidatus Margulisbacteria bacterium GWE2_39_32]PZM83767.1 MAG: hypothetical protein DKM50_01445 [Candidatus Margulisiibacteriota bacterium]HAR63041.1 hypothetical protein [Candidatus Margulisiibacteriota bacterium]
MNKLLLLDDNHFVVMSFKGILDSKYILLVARNYDEALKLYSEEPDIEVIISDVNLQDYRTGLDFVNLVRMNNPYVQIIFCSGENNYDYVKDHCCRYLPKPVMPDVLLESIEKALQYREQLVRKNKQLFHNLENATA